MTTITNVTATFKTKTTGTKLKSTVGFSISKQNIEQLEKYAQENNYTKSDIVDKLLSAFLKDVAHEQVDT